MTIGERIKRRREDLGYTQEELAKKCGYKSRSSINKIELSRSLPLSKVKIMADALETTPSKLMGWVEETELLQNQFKEDRIAFEDLISDDSLSIEDKKRLINDHTDKNIALVQAVKDTTDPEHNDITSLIGDNKIRIAHTTIGMSPNHSDKDIKQIREYITQMNLPIEESDGNTSKALDLYRLYLNAPDNVRLAVDALLKGDPHET